MLSTVPRETAPVLRAHQRWRAVLALRLRARLVPDLQTCETIEGWVWLMLAVYLGRPRRVTRRTMTVISLLMMTLTGCDEPSEDAPTDATEAAASTEDATPRDDAKAVPASTDNIPAPSDVAAPPADAQKTESGLAYKVLSAGTGDDTPSELSTVEVHYTGCTTDGTHLTHAVRPTHEVREVLGAQPP